MANNNSEILILIPAYNAGRYLVELVTRITKTIPDADILMIDDGSSDDTSEVLESLDVIALVNNPNRGKGYTLQRGFDYARDHKYRYVITIDADLQHSPEEIPRFMEQAEKHDVIIGVRDIDLKIMPFARWLTNNLTSLLVSIFAGKRIRDSQSGYRMFRTEVLDKFTTRSWRYDYESEILLQTGMAGLSVGEAKISTIYEDSESSIHPFRDTIRFVRLLWQKIML